MRHDVYAMYIMAVSIVVIGAAGIALIIYDRKAQKAHREWMNAMENDRPKNRTWL